jgi:integrase
VKGVTVAGLLDRYLQEAITPCINIPLGGLDEGKMSSLCAKAYRANINNWLRPRWGRYLVTDFLQPQVRTAAEEWLESLLRSERNSHGLAPKTVHGIGTLFRQIFRRAVKWGYLENNPLDFVDLPEGSTRRQKRPRSLGPGEYLSLVELYGPRERAAIEIAGWMGPRRSDGFGLKWQDLDFERKVVSFRQGFVAGRVTPLKTEASQAEVSMPEDVVNALLAWRKITPYRAPGDWGVCESHYQGQAAVLAGVHVEADYPAYCTEERIWAYRLAHVPALVRVRGKSCAETGGNERAGATPEPSDYQREIRRTFPKGETGRLSPVGPVREAVGPGRNGRKEIEADGDDASLWFDAMNLSVPSCP